MGKAFIRGVNDHVCASFNYKVYAFIVFLIVPLTAYSSETVQHQTKLFSIRDIKKMPCHDGYIDSDSDEWDIESLGTASTATFGGALPFDYKDLDEAVRTIPLENQSELWYYAGRKAVREGKNKEAAEFYQKAVESKHSLAALLCLHGKCSALTLECVS